MSASIRKKIPAVWCEGAPKNPDRLEFVATCSNVLSANLRSLFLAAFNSEVKFQPKL